MKGYPMKDMNVPNTLTLLRILLAPVLVAVYHKFGQWWGAAVLLAAYVTDFLDGFLARRMHCVTKLGMTLDPLADKLLMAAVLLCMFDTGRVPVWCMCVMLTQAAYLIAGGVCLVRRHIDMIPSNRWGKSATVLFFLSAVCLFPDYPWAWVMHAGQALLSGAVLLMLCAAVSYTKIALARAKEQSDAVDR